MSAFRIPLAFDIYARDAPNPASDPRLVRISRPLMGSGFRVEEYGVGGGVLVVDRNDAECTAANFNDGNYVDVVDTRLNKSLGGFFMPAGTATLLSAAAEKGGQTFTVKGDGTLSYLGLAEWLNLAYIAPGGGAGVGTPINSPRDDGQWHWPNNAYGAIVERAILEAQDPDRPENPIPAVTVDFTYSTDSASNPFTTYSGDFTQGVGANYLDTMADMIRLGLTPRMHPNFLLQLFQNEPGTDRSSTTFASGKVRFVGGSNIAEDTLSRTLQPDVSLALLLVQGKSPDPANMVQVAGSGRGEGFLQYGVTDDAGALADAGATNLALRERQTDIARFKIVPGDSDTDGNYTPSWPGDGGHFWTGDIVTIHTGTGQQDYNNVALRVAAIEWQLEEAGRADVFVELGSNYYNFSHPSAAIGGTIGSSGGCTCPLPAPACVNSSEVVTGYEHYTWEDGVPEPIAHPYVPLGAVQTMLEADTYWGGGAAGTSYGGDFGQIIGANGDAASGAIVAVPGTTYRFRGYNEGYGQSWPCTGFGIVNFSWGVNWYDSGGTLLRTDVIGSHTTGQDTGYVGPDEADFVAPVGAAYFRLACNRSGLGCQQGRTHIDEVTISTVVAADDDPLCGAGAYSDDVVHYGPVYIPSGSGLYIPAGSTINPPTAAEVPFDDSTAALGVTNVQDAIDVLQGEIGGATTLSHVFDPRDPAYGAAADGVTDDTAAIVAALADAVLVGGVVNGGGKTYLISGNPAITVSDNSRITFRDIVFKFGANVTAVKVTAQAGGGAHGVVFENVYWWSTSTTGTTALYLEDQDRVSVLHSRIDSCAVGIDFHPSAEWVEGTALEDVWITDCATGIRFFGSGGTHSFMETSLRNVGVNNCAIGIDIQAQSQMYRSDWVNVTVWPANGGTGVIVDGDMEGFRASVGFDGGAGGGGSTQTSWSIGTNAANLDKAEIWTQFAMTGVTHTAVAGANAGKFVYKIGSRTYSTGATAAGRYVGVTASGAPASGTYVAGDWCTTQDGSLYICTAGGTPGTWSAVSGASFATPSIALGTAAAAGAAGTVIRSDSTIAAFDSTVPVTQAYSDAAATGSVAFAARRDHRHGMPAAAGIGEILISDSPSTPLVFGDLLQNEAQDDLLYADP